MTKIRKKLIEVALPLGLINDAAAEERAVPRRGHPSTLHLWWARRPLAVCRGVLFAQLVDDPSSVPELFPSEVEQKAERERLFRLIAELVKWENIDNEDLLHSAQSEIAVSDARRRLACGELKPGDLGNRVLCDDPDHSAVEEYLSQCMPPVWDPFAGGGSIPIEAQRLGLRAVASDLNPVAVLLNRAQIELPAQFGSTRSIGRDALILAHEPGVAAFAADLVEYGEVVRKRVYKRLAGLYPKVRVPDSLGGGEATPIAWIWARTVPSPDPSFAGCHTPLVSNFVLSENGDRAAFIHLEVNNESKKWQPVVLQGQTDAAAKKGTKAGRGSFKCVFTGAPITAKYVQAKSRAGELRSRLIACVAVMGRRRFYLSISDEDETRALSAKPSWVPDTEMPEKALGFRVQLYGILRHEDLFLPRQKTALAAFSEEIRRVVCDVEAGAREAKREPGQESAEIDPAVYGKLVATYLSFALGKLADWLSMFCSFIYGYEKFGHTFGKQTLSMVWDFAEINPFSDAAGNWSNHVKWVADAVGCLPGREGGSASVLDATRIEDQGNDIVGSGGAIFSSDPPYYDNIGYADLSDFFYVWLRETVGHLHPDLFSTMLVPKQDELVAAPARFGGDKDAAQQHFEEGLFKALSGMRSHAASEYPVTIYYAFKQSEAKKGSDGDAAFESSTGWESMLESLMRVGFQIVGTWPVRSERLARLRSLGSNALASSIVLVCRPRPEEAGAITRGDFRRLLKTELQISLRQLEEGRVAPVDMAQASIGPGMAIFSRHTHVLEADGSTMAVRSALQLINEVVDEARGEKEGEFEPYTRFAITWFETHGFEKGPFGEAETLATSRAISVAGVEEAGILSSVAGKVRLHSRRSLPTDWSPAADEHLTVWAATQHLIKRLEGEGEQEAAALLLGLGAKAEQARNLAYRLYTTCERKKWAEEARAYNGLVLAWPELERLAAKSETSKERETQADLFEDNE